MPRPAPAGREQDGAGEEGDGVGLVTQQLDIAGERADQEATRPEREAQCHPAPSSHENAAGHPDRMMLVGAAGPRIPVVHGVLQRGAEY